MRFLRNSIVAAVFLAMPFVVQAGLISNIPSCYRAFHLSAPGHPYNKLVYVLIDQTVLLNRNLEKSVIENLNRMIRPGTKIAIAEFSSFSQGHYLQVLHTAIVERPLPKLAYGNIPLTQVSQIKSCFVDQRAYAIKLLDSAAMRVMKSSSFSLAHSDIMSALKMVSKSIRQDPAQNKILIVVSDGLENSSLMTFYANNAVRGFNPKIELEAARKANLFGNFGGARVYVIGGAMIPPAKYGTLSQRQAYHSPTVLLDLRDFWRGYFRASKARLIEFGEPVLLESVSYD